jgi:putative Mg2+ transporter-C (MgtC) family protein
MEAACMAFTTASVWEITHLELGIRMVLAVVLGGIIGIEREWSNHAAGFRTHILVCLGSAMIMLLSIYGFSQFVNEANVRMDPARLAAQVISGIGFLGAGAILRNGNMINGLTTAASVWVVAAIGLSVGAGFYMGALFCTFLVLISLFVLNKWEKHLLRNRRYDEVVIKIIDYPGALGRVATILDNYELQIVNLQMIPHTDRRAGVRQMRMVWS